MFFEKFIVEAVLGGWLVTCYPNNGAAPERRVFTDLKETQSWVLETCLERILELA